MAKTQPPGAIRVIATAMGFCGKLIEKGETFTIPDEQAFTPAWMQRLDPQQAAAAKADEADEAEQTGLKYVAKSNGGGAFIVVDQDGNRASRRFLKTEGDARRLAEDEAVRLNAGGTLILDPLTTPSTQAIEAEQEGDPNLPDA